MTSAGPTFQTILVDDTLDLLSKLRDRTRLTSAIAVLTQDEQRGLVLASLPGTSDHTYVPRVGFRFHLHATAPGKALLAFLPQATRVRIVKGIDLKRFTDRTICTEQSLIEHLKECAKNRIAFDKGEYVSGVNCVASCITDDNGSPLATVWITSLAIDLPEADLPNLGQVVQASVREMELRLRNIIGSLSPRHGYAMERAKLFIEQHFHDEEAIGRYPESLGMSESWFRRLFREKHGSPRSAIA